MVHSEVFPNTRTLLFTWIMLGDEGVDEESSQFTVDNSSNDTAMSMIILAVSTQMRCHERFREIKTSFFTENPKLKSIDSKRHGVATHGDRGQSGGDEGDIAETRSPSQEGQTTRTL